MVGKYIYIYIYSTYVLNGKYKPRRSRGLYDLFEYALPWVMWLSLLENKDGIHTIEMILVSMRTKTGYIL